MSCSTYGLMVGGTSPGLTAAPVRAGVVAVGETVAAGVGVDEVGAMGEVTAVTAGVEIAEAWFDP